MRDDPGFNREEDMAVHSLMPRAHHLELELREKQTARRVKGAGRGDLEKEEGRMEAPGR